ncbi:MAG: hypothetical protein ACR2JU_07480 [Nocardioidaceae bacterium]
MSHHLDEVRELILARRARAGEVAARFQAWLADGAAERPLKCLAVRCTSAGHAGSAPKMAEVAATSHGVLFVCRLPWAASDQLTLRPWEREQMLGAGLDGRSLEMCLSDDDFLMDWLARLDSWSAGHQPDGPRWLRKAPPQQIREVVDLPSADGMAGLWTRCPRHLNDFKALSPDDVLAAAFEHD